jgi:glycosyltransferase involved in cell wall biosynthesis
MPNPRVALFVRRFLPYSQTFIHDEINAHERYAVDVFCQKRLNADRFPHDRVFYPDGWLGKRIYENVGYWPDFDRRLGSGDYDLVHAHFGTAAVYALPYVIRHDLPLVVTFWGNDVSALLGTQRYNPKNWRYVCLYKTIFQKSSLILCVSQEMSELVRELGAPSENIQVWSQGIDLDRFQPTESESNIPQVILVGRFTSKKGHIYAIRAFADAIANGYEAHLTFVGSGKLESDCRELVAENGISNHVTFAGSLPHEAVARRLAESDLALVPSVVAHNHDREGSPTVAKEAGACGIPVIATYHAGLPEIVEDGKTGFLVPERNVSALADRIKRLLSSSDLRSKMGNAARRKIEHDFELQAQVRKLESYYDRVRRTA